MTESKNLLSQIESITDQYKSLYEKIRELIYVKYQYEYPVIFTHALFTQRPFILYNEVELHFKKLDISSFDPIDFSTFQQIYSINADIRTVANPSDDLSSINERIIYYLNVAAYLKSQESRKTETDIIHRRYYDYHLSELERWFDNRNLYLAKVKATFKIKTTIQEKVIPFKKIKALLAITEDKDEICLPKNSNGVPQFEHYGKNLLDRDNTYFVRFLGWIDVNGEKLYKPYMGDSYIVIPDQIGLFTKEKALQLGKDFKDNWELITDCKYIENLWEKVKKQKEQSEKLESEKSGFEEQMESMKSKKSEPIPEVQTMVDLYKLLPAEKSNIRKMGKTGITKDILDKYIGAKSISLNNRGNLNKQKCSKILGLDKKTFIKYQKSFDEVILSTENSH